MSLKVQTIVGTSIHNHTTRRRDKKVSHVQNMPKIYPDSGFFFEKTFRHDFLKIVRKTLIYFENFENSNEKQSFCMNYFHN